MTIPQTGRPITAGGSRHASVGGCHPVRHAGVAGERLTKLAGPFPVTETHNRTVAPALVVSVRIRSVTFRLRDPLSRTGMTNMAPATADLLRTHPLVEEILDSHREHAGGDERGWAGYRGHVYRVLNLARVLVPDRDDKLAIAAAFHDIDAFSTLNYLGPSIRTMDAWLQRTGRGAWAEELAVVVAQHHRLAPYKGRHAALAEAFRRADLNDLSQGLIRSRLPREHVRAVREAIDVGVFFTRTVPAAIVRHVIRHPLDPVPILRARRALAETGHRDADR